jgi:hypothetical protein
MKNKIKTIVLSVMALGLIVAVPVTTVSSVGAAANIRNCLTQGTNLDGTIGANGDCTGDQSNTTSSADLNDTIASVVNIISIVVGVVAVIMIIWGGLKYITSGGESGKITSAKNTIIYALIGLVIVALAQFIVRFVLSKATDVAN